MLKVERNNATNIREQKRWTISYAHSGFIIGVIKWSDFSKEFVFLSDLKFEYKQKVLKCIYEELEKINNV